ncbi:MAG: orotidine-5'-phosphate decarboxylase [Bifidobacteriaceae bacterium]|jgi:orotidine-5'-phosphate decarboxylase|nr:orotidine-5'-phosphate decarboxylase [Bifidobacteriaceae bacterium]
MMPFGERLATAFRERSHLAVGIDPAAGALGAWGLPDTPAGLERFAAGILEAAWEGGAAAIKPQAAFFERHGAGGIGVLERLLARAREMGLLTILDVKRGDIGSTMEGYAQAYLAATAPLAADAVTLSPYLGFGSLRPALDAAARTGRGVFVLAFTSNPEGLSVQRATSPAGIAVGDAMIQAAAAANAGATPMGSVGLVIGATIGSFSPVGAELITQVNGPILAPGVGAQGAGPAQLADLFGKVRHLVLATSSRAVAAAGPPKGALVAAVRRNAQQVSFLGN